MKKVINITLSSIVFAIEEDAHAVLAEYLDAVTTRLGESADKLEIITDIENAIAEKFTALGKSEKFAVSLADVKRIESEMGAPAAFGEEEDVNTGAAATAPTESKRRLFRDTDDVVVAGVASGLARYFDIDPVIVRIAFVVTAFLNGLGFIAYLILWVAVPKAETTTEKFAMRGQRVTVEDIANGVKKNLNNTSFPDKAKVSEAWLGLRSVFEKVFGLVGGLIRVGLRLLRYLVGIGSIVLGALGAAGLVSAYSIVLLSEKTFLPTEAQRAIEIMFNSSLGIVAIAASFVAALIPLLAIIVLGTSLLKKRNLFTTGKTVTLAVVWIVAVALAGTTSALQVEKVWQEVGGDIDVAQYLGEDLEVVITEHGVSINSPVIPAPAIPPEVRTALSGITLSPAMTKLDLSSRGLKGSLPAEVRLLSRLEVLDLSNNYFTGLPAEVGQLKELRQLDLSDNKFTGLPHELGNLQNLEVLDLRGNNISEFDLDIIVSNLPARATILRD